MANPAPPALASRIGFHELCLLVQVCLTHTRPVPATLTVTEEARETLIPF